MSPSDPKRPRDPLAEFRALSARIDALLQQQVPADAANSAPSTPLESELRLAKAGARGKAQATGGEQEAEDLPGATERRRAKSGS